MDAAATIVFSAGALIRSRVLQELKRSAFEAGVNINIKEFGGFFVTDYGITITGEATRVQAYVKAIRNWMLELETNLKED